VIEWREEAGKGMCGCVYAVQKAIKHHVVRHIMCVEGNTTLALYSCV